MPPDDSTTASNVPAASKPNRHPFRTRFAHVSPEEASGEKVPLTAKREAAEVTLSKLILTPAQEISVEALYSKNKIEKLTYTLTDEEQITAAAFLASVALDESSQNELGSRWSVRNTRESGTGSEKTMRVLYQCDCGYSHAQAGWKKRLNPMPFTHCLGHAEVLYIHGRNKVLSVRGYFEHNDACKNAHIRGYPRKLVHPDVYKVALAQLRAGADVEEVRQTNERMANSRAYPSQPKAGDLKTNSAYRWVLEKGDNKSLYRQFNRLQGVQTTTEPHINIDDWLNKDSPQYNAALAEAIFYYSARRSRDDRLKVCIATPEMKEAAWTYAHQSQIILDGTFGICNRKLLLFIVMAIDEDRKGVPLAFLLFSAPTKNKQTSAGYDAAILTELLTEWKRSLGRRNGQEFTVYVAITDTDLMERNALAAVFEDIWLLICKFHLRQSWRNHRNRELRGNSPLARDLKSRLSRLETRLVHTTKHDNFLSVITEERTFLSDYESALDGPEGLEGSVLIAGAKTHLDYLDGYWGTQALWQSWSDFGRCVAAVRLGCEVEGVLPTTNHLESFNNVFKRKHLRRWQRSGRRLRVDMLVHLSITKILPAIYRKRATERKAHLEWEEQVRQLPGGQALLDQDKASRSGRALGYPVAYVPSDALRDSGAQELLSYNQISVPSVTSLAGVLTFSFNCYSSLSTPHDTSPLMYQVVLSQSRTGSCTCPDFQARGGACKHIRAALLRLDALRISTNTHLPLISLPSSLEEARQIEASLMLKTGAIPTPVQAQVVLASQELQHAADAVDDMLETLNINDDAIGPRELEDEDPDGNSDSDLDNPDEDGDGDTMSIATDASGPPIDTPYDFTALKLSSKQAISEQSTSQALHELEGVAPKLGLLSQVLENARLRDQEDLDLVNAIKPNIDALAAQLSRLLSEDSTGASKNDSDSATAAAFTRLTTSRRPTTPPNKASGTTKRRRSDILNASPEKAQKRKQSYGVH